ncbi:hypothetical protein DNU06_04310 [Putridiphycobacter roseus]|uniref:Uncharacterized protein n=2 Tax=Putridiphycobacter roseus TaxID=2219161 RepID=A0A2W1NT33_9FLAO|nr:hypothetical protein DNU06_04310 [Putridiphycobacter roseus]
MNFNSKEEADLFESKMTAANLWFEKDTEDHQGDILYLFAVKNREFDLVQKINFEVNAKFRKNFIPNKTGRYVLVGFFLFIMLIALIGYFKTNY